MAKQGSQVSESAAKAAIDAKDKAASDQSSGGGGGGGGIKLGSSVSQEAANAAIAAKLGGGDGGGRSVSRSPAKVGSSVSPAVANAAIAAKSGDAGPGSVGRRFAQQSVASYGGVLPPNVPLFPSDFPGPMPGYELGSPQTAGVGYGPNPTPSQIAEAYLYGGPSMGIYGAPGPEAPGAPGPEAPQSIAERYLAPQSAFEQAMGLTPLGFAVPQAPFAAPVLPERSFMGPDTIADRSATAAPFAPQYTLDDYVSAASGSLPRPAGLGGLGGMSVAEFNAQLPLEASFLPEGFGAETSPVPQMRPGLERMRPEMRPPQPVEDLGFTEFGRVFGEPITPYTTLFDAPAVPGAVGTTVFGAVSGAPSVPMAGALPSSRLPPAPVSMSAAPGAFLEEILPGSPGVSGLSVIPAGLRPSSVPPDLDTSTPVAGDLPLQTDYRSYALPGPAPEAMVSTPPLFFGGSLNSAAGQAPAVGGNVGAAPAQPLPVAPDIQMRDAAPLGSQTTLPPPNMDPMLSTAAPGLSAPPVLGGIGSLPVAGDDRYAASVPGFALPDQARSSAPRAGIESLPVVPVPAGDFAAPQPFLEEILPSSPGASGLSVIPQGVRPSTIPPDLDTSTPVEGDLPLGTDYGDPRPAPPDPSMQGSVPGLGAFPEGAPSSAPRVPPSFDDGLSINAFGATPFGDIPYEGDLPMRLSTDPGPRPAGQASAEDPLAGFGFEERPDIIGETDLSRGTGLGGMGLEASSSGSSLAPTPANVAADAAASQRGIAEGSFAPVIGGPSIGAQLAAAGINAVNPLLRGRDRGGEGGFLGRITGGRPLFGEDGIIPPSDPYTIEDFMADQAAMEEEGSQRRVATGPEGYSGDRVSRSEAFLRPVFGESLEDRVGSSAPPPIPPTQSLGQYGGIEYAEAPPVTLPSGYSMSLEDYLALLGQMPGGPRSANPGLLTVTPLNLGIGSLT